MGISALGNSNILPLCVLSKYQESPGGTELGVMDKSSPVGEFVNTEATDSELYLCP